MAPLPPPAVAVTVCPGPPAMADITGKILDFARAAKALDKGEGRECAKLAEMVKALLLQVYNH